LKKMRPLAGPFGTFYDPHSDKFSWIWLLTPKPIQDERNTFLDLCRGNRYLCLLGLSWPE